MPDLLASALQTEGLIYLGLAFLIAGVVRGFTGFGTGMIVIPIGAMLMPLPHVILILAFAGMGAAVSLLPKAWPVAQKGEVLKLSGAAILTMPLGISLLILLDPIVLRWALTFVIFALIACLIGGWRYNAQLKTTGLLATGGAAGIVGGTTGLTGPVVILFYLASANAVNVIRANTILFLAILDVAIAVNILWRGLADLSLLVTALIVTVPYFFASLIGQALFDPDKERMYRAAAYAIVIGVAVISMPIFD